MLISDPRAWSKEAMRGVRKREKTAERSNVLSAREFV